MDYTVQPGDSMYSLGLKGNVPAAEVREANNMQSNNIRVGEDMFIPYEAKDADISRDMNMGIPTEYDVPEHIVDTEGFASKRYKSMGHDTIGYGYDLKQNAKYLASDFAKAGIKDKNQAITKQQASVLYNLSSKRQFDRVSKVLGYDITKQGEMSKVLEVLAFGGDIMNRKSEPGHYELFKKLKKKDFSGAIETAKNINLSSNRLFNRLMNL
jgi:hypothetical protein